MHTQSWKEHRLRAVLPLSVLAVLPLLQAVPLRAQNWTGNNRLHGTIADESGHPVEGATVTLRPGRWTVNPANLEHSADSRLGESLVEVQMLSAEQGPSPVKTDKNGSWSFLGLAPGVWGVLIEKDGLVPYNSRVIAGPGLLGLIKITLKAPTAEQVQRDKTIASLKQAVELKPDDAGSRQLLVRLLVGASRPAEAQPYLAALPPDARVDAATLVSLGTQLYNSGHLDTAVAIFGRVVAENPDLAAGYFFRGLSSLDQKKFPEAKADFQRLLAIDPQGPFAAAARVHLQLAE
jgi:tetratricopeptide (TPR) repeat protein